MWTPPLCEVERSDASRVGGLMAGSLRKLWPFVDYAAGGREVLTLPSAGDPEVLSVGLMFCVGVAAVLLLDAVGRRQGGGDPG